MGRAREAVAALEHMLHSTVYDQSDLAEATFALGEARFALRPHDPAALAMVLNARLTFELLGPVQSRRAGDADKWLALHARR